MAKAGRRRVEARRRPLPGALEALKARRWLAYLLEALLVILLAAGAFMVRIPPWYNAWSVVEKLEEAGLSRQVAELGFLHANDPWIEYWLAKKLYENGLGYWYDLRPGLDPECSKFWYPWGRDFTTSEYPAVPMLIALTYPLVRGSMPLTAWAALFPPMAGAAMVVAGYALVRRLAGPVAAAVAATLLAFLPATASRTVAGFIEKEGISMPLLMLWLLAYCESLRAGSRVRRLVTSLAAGLVGGLLAWFWGGWQLVPLTLAATALLTPLFAEDPRPYLEATAAGALASLMVTAPCPALPVTRVAKVYAAALVSVAVAAGLHQVLRKALGRLWWAGYLAALAAAAAAAAYAALAGVIPVSTRGVMALLWPLRRQLKLTPLAESVAEHQQPSLHMLASDVGVALVLGPVGCLVALYYAWRRKWLHLVPVAVLGLGGLDAAVGMAYFIQLGGALLSVCSALTLMPPSLFLSEALGRGEEAGAGRRRRAARRAAGSELRGLAVVALAGLVLVFTIPTALAAVSEYRSTKSMLPSVLTGGVGMGVNPGWMVTLELLRTRTPPDAVVVTWWDYGYWVTVGSGRATLADGATINATHIALLAKILVGSETTASELMRSLGLQPNKTFVLVHDVVVVRYEPNRTLAIFPPVGGARGVYGVGLIDIPKSYWMIRISGARPIDYFGVRVVPGSGARIQGPDPLKEAAREAVIYRILADAAYRLDGKGAVVLTDKPVTKSVDMVVFGGAAWPVEPLKHFRPWAIVAYSIPGFPVRGNSTAYLLIAIYQWTG